MVYVFSLEKVESGGPELLHQLVYVLNLTGVEARIVYISRMYPYHIVDTPTIDAYEKYNVIRETNWDVIDREDNIVVIPELGYDLFSKIKNATKVAWWLSVDGYIEAVKAQHGLSAEDMQVQKNLDYYNFSDRTDVIHLGQSYYAMDFLQNRLCISPRFIDYLSDYLNDIYLEGAVTDNSQRKDMVIFNPAKGGSRLKSIIDATKDEIFWYPLENMTREKVRAAMNLAKIYVDVGEHPGKDRIPREAAISGCCVITGRRGSAAYHEDVPIPDRYKIDDSSGVDTDMVRDMITDIFANFDERQKDFSEYREMIMAEKERFVTDVIRLFR